MLSFNVWIRRAARPGLAAVLACAALLPSGPWTSGTASAAGQEPVALLVGKPYAEADGKKVRLEIKPFVRSGSTLVPVRFISEQLGALVTWEGDTGTVAIRKDKILIRVTVGQHEMTVNGNTVSLEAAPELVRGNVLVPLRAIGEAMGQKVLYDNGLILIGSQSVIAAYDDSASKKDAVRERLAPDALRIGMSADPYLLDSAKATASASFSVLNSIQEGLYRTGPDGNLAPGLAKELPAVSADGLTYTIRLREGLQWSDGSPLTARDFVYACRRALDPDTHSQYSFLMLGIQGAKALNQDSGSGNREALKEGLGVTAVDSTTLEIRLEKPSTAFGEYLGLPVFFPVQQAAAEAAGDRYGFDAETMVSSGPYVLYRWDHDYQIVLEKNELYWDASNVTVEELNFNMTRNSDINRVLLQSGQLDLVNDPYINETMKGYQVLNRKEPTNMFISLQVEKVPAFANANIRRALAMSIDREGLVGMLQNNYVPSTGFVPHGILDGSGGEFRSAAGSTQPGYNPAEARKLLQAGLKELGLQELPSFKLLADDTPSSRQTLSYIAGQWMDHLGIFVDLDPQSHGIRVEKQHNKNFDAVLELWGADYNDPMTFLDMYETDGAFNDTGYSNPAYDKLIQDARVETDRAVRTGLLVQAEKQLMSDAPVIPLYYRYQKFYISNRVEGVYLPLFGPVWELKYARLKARPEK